MKSYLRNTLLPLLRDRGVTPAQLDRIFRTNPARLFSLPGGQCGAGRDRK